MRTMMRVMLAGAAEATLRLDADATTLPVVAVGTAVTSWPDQSGTGRHGSGASGTATYQTAINGRACVRTTAVAGAAFSFPRPVEDDWTIYLVFQTSSAGSGSDGSQYWNGAPIFDSEISTPPGSSRQDWGITMKSTGHVAVGIGNPDTTVTATSPSVKDGLPHLICVTRSASAGAAAIYVDEVLVGSGNLTLGTKSENPVTYIGRSKSIGTLVGDYGRILAYATVHDATTRAAKHALLRAQFGL